MMLAPLLADRSSCLRALVHRYLVAQDAARDGEIEELAAIRADDPLATELTALQQPDGQWKSGDGAWRAHSHALMLTCTALSRLGYLGFDRRYPAVARGADFLFARQRKDGAWPLPRGGQNDDEGVSETPLQTAIPLRALALCGYACDERAEAAYEWLLDRRLDDGAWPTGKTRGDYRRVAAYRRLAHSELGCRSNTTATLQCLALHSKRRHGDAARRGLDLLLGRETRDAQAFGFDLARLLGAHPVSGFISFFARYDAVSLLDLCARIGATRADERVSALIEFAQSLRGRYGLWHCANAPQCDRWISYDVLRSLSQLDEQGDWLSFEPRTPFRRTRRKRF